MEKRPIPANDNESKTAQFGERKLLTEEERRSLLKDAAAGESDESLADKYGLPTSRVQKLRYNHKRRLKQMKKNLEAEKAKRAAESKHSHAVLEVRATLGDRFTVKGNTFRLDDRPTPLPKIILEANFVRFKWGQAPISYPKVHCPNDNHPSGPAMKLHGPDSFA